jgi:hypothetical protein
MIDIINPTADGTIEVRNTIVIDGVEAYVRWTLLPGQNILGQDPSVQEICNTIWTTEVIAAYQAKISERLL